MNYNFEERLYEFLKGELRESFPELSSVIKRRESDGKIVILVYGKGRLEEVKRTLILQAIAEKFFEVRKFIFGLDDKLDIGAAFKKL